MATKIPSVLSLIQANVLERPDATAVTQGDTQLSYGDLSSAYRAISNLLRASGVGAGDVVPILTTRCPLAVACVLGVVAVGAAWVPMDAESWSRQRVQTVLETVDHKCLLLTERTNMDWLSALGETIVWVDDDELIGAGQCRTSTDSVDVQSQGPKSVDDCAYIIFTSGTTGRPKGVAVAHRSLLHYVESGDAQAPFNMGVRPEDAVLLLFSVAFDAYYGVLMSTLCRGGQIVMSAPATLIADVKKCTIIPVTPSLLGTLPPPAEYPKIRAIFLGGESPSPELIKKWWSPGRKIYNAYGPTEATIATSIAELSPDAPVTLGVPIRQSQMLLLDDALQPCSEGEICIAGPNVAIGYYKDDARTAEKFFRLENGEGDRVYRTGDLGKRGADGHVIFLGRRDHVVKNRGFLINIETEVLPALLAQEGVHFAAAFMHRQRLVAFIAPASTCPSPDVLRRSMAGRYDDFVIPDDLRAVETLPQTSNGKVDTSALAALLERSGPGQEGRDGPGEESVSDIATGGSSSSDLRSKAIRNAVAEALGIAPSAVDMASSFKDLGGTSLLAIRVLFRLQEAGFSLLLSQLFTLPSLAQASECLLEAVADGGVKATAAAPSVSGTNPSSGLMTATQMGIVASTLRDPPRGYMVVRMTLPHHGDDMGTLDLEGAWKSVIHRHVVFRASFDIIQGKFDTAPEPAAVIWKHLVVKPGSPRLPQDVVEQEYSSLIAQAREHTLASDGTAFRPLLAFTLITSTEAEPTLLWLVHHAQIDGWSVGTVVRDVREILYGENDRSPAASAGSDFAVYATALRPYVDSVRDDATRFWSVALDGLLEGTTLKLAPSLEVSTLGDQERTQEDSAGRFGAHSLNMGVTLAEAEVNARVYGVSPAVAFYAAWALILSRYSAREDVVFGTVLSGRNFPLPGGVGGIVGPLINTCPFPVRTRGSGSDTTTQASNSKSSYLAGVHNQLLAMADYQWSAAEALDHLAPGSHAAIYGTAVFLEYELDGFSDSYTDRNGGELLGPWRFERQDIPEFKLTLQGQLGSDGELVFRALFDRTLYSEALITQMLSHFRNLYLALMDPRVSDVGQVRAAMMDPSEFLTVTRQSPTLFEPYLGPATIKDAFEAGLPQWPSAIAIESPADGILTYRELDRVTNHLARHINTLFPPGGRRVVAVIGDRSRNWLVGALSIVKAGAVYLPLDSQLPNQRMRVMVETAGAVACMYSGRQSLATLPDVHPRQIIISEILGQLETAGTGDAASTACLPTTSTADEYAYIMFTSGSTGVPKGICVSHRSTMSHLAYPPARLHAGPGRRHAQMFSPGFDVSIAEVFGALIHGATLVLPDAGDPFAHLGRAHATMMTPSFLAVCAPADLANLDTIYLIGEAVPRHLADTWCVGGRTVYNAYGPCECTIAALFKRLEPRQPVTLGRTIPRVGVYILDDERQPVPVGVVGEIYLTGVQVTEGYIGEHMAKATRSVFLDDPFVPGLRMYKTGDAAAWTESLEVQFLGRLDDSLVKVRGYRVELDEVALAIRRSDSRIQAAVAIVSEDKDRILAFVSPATVDTRGVLASLAAALPPYARPSVLIALDRFPTTPNQKLDRKALQRLASQSPGHDRTAGLANGGIEGGTGQLTATEKLLSRVWSEVLRLPEELAPSAEDDFLALGGNSLRQITAAQKVSSTLGVRVPLSLFVKNPGLRELAKELDLFHTRHNEQHAEQGMKNGSDGSFLSFLSATGPQEKDEYGERASHLELELFEMHERSHTPSTFNVSHVLELAGRVDLDVLERAIRQIVRKSDILRCCFRRDAQDGQLRRTLDSIQDREFVVHRWGADVDYAAKEQELISAPFDLGRDQLTRIALVETNEGAQCKLVLVQHHIITDQTSARRFFQILGELYTHLLSSGTGGDYSDGKEPAPPSYASWACWKSGQLQLQLAAVGSTAQGRFWKDKLATADSLPRLFPPRLCANDQSGEGGEGAGHMSFTAYPPLGGSMRATKAGVAAPRPMEHFLAAAAAALGRSAGNADVVVCIPFIDRLEPGTEEILGLFLDRLPVRVRLPAALAAAATPSSDEGAADLRAPLRATVAAARREIQEALSHALPGRCIAEVLNGAPGSEGLFDVMLVYNRSEDSVAGDLRMRGVASVRSVSKRAPGAKFPFLVEFNELEDGAVICEIEYMPERVSPGFVGQIVADLKKLLPLLEDA